MNSSNRSNDNTSTLAEPLSLRQISEPPTVKLAEPGDSERFRERLAEVTVLS